MWACARAYVTKHTHFNAWTHIHSHAFVLRHSNSMFKTSVNFTSAWATPTHSRVLGSHVAEHSTAWLYVDEDNIPTHASSDTRLPHWQDAQSEESSMKDLRNQLRWSLLEAEWRPVVGGEKEGGNSRENPGVSEVWFCIQRRDLVFHRSAVISLTEAFTKPPSPSGSCRLHLNRVWRLMEGDTCQPLNTGQLQIPTWLRETLKRSQHRGHRSVTWRHVV